MWREIKLYDRLISRRYNIGDDEKVKKQIRLSGLPTILPLILLTVMFVFLPLFGMVADSFQSADQQGFTLGNYIEILENPVYSYSIKNSLYLSVLSTIVGIIVSFFIALSIMQVGGKLQNCVMAILNMVSNFAGIPLATAFIVILGNSGVLVMALSLVGIDLSEVFSLYSVDGLLLLFIYFQIPLGTLMLLPAFQGLRQEWKEAADLMGASSVQYWIKVGIPVMMPSIADTISLLFANALTTYATVLMLTATNIPLLAIKISTMFTGERLQQPELGSALTIVMLFIMFIAIAAMYAVKKGYGKGGNN